MTLLEMQPDILNDMMIMTKVCLLEMIQKAGIKVKTQFKVKEITETAVIGEDASGNTVSIPAVQVISAFGYKSYNLLEEIAKNIVRKSMSLVVLNKQVALFQQLKKV